MLSGSTSILVPMLRTLKPIIDRVKYYQIIEDEIKELFYVQIYKPILDLASSPMNRGFQNAPNYLLEAIRSGKIAYVDGYFVGDFNAQVGLAMRKLGATFNGTKKAYAIQRYQLPLDVQHAIDEGARLLQQRLSDIYGHLEHLQKNDITKSINFDSHFSGIFLDLDKQFSSTVNKDLSVPMDKSPYMQDALKKNYTENLNLEIKKWYSESVLRLRQKVNKNVEEGFRANKLIPIIQAEKNISYRRANFIAKQETSLLVSQYREQRYTHAGLKRYKWLTSEDARVRPNLEARKTGHTANNHRILNGRIFSWDEPPIVDSATGRRCHPGMDYGCRCLAIPVIE